MYVEAASVKADYVALEKISNQVDQQSIVWRLSGNLPMRPGQTLSLTGTLPNKQCITIRSCQTAPQNRVSCNSRAEVEVAGGSSSMRMSPCRRGSGVGIASVRSKEMFMGFRKSSVSSSLPGLLDRLRKRCVTVNLRFPTVFFGSEF